MKIKYKTALLANKAGFRARTTHMFDRNGELQRTPSIKEVVRDGGLEALKTPNQIFTPTQEVLHKWIRKNRGVLIQVYNNASGYLWALAKVPGGTDLGWSDFTGNCEMSGCFKSYEDAYEDALELTLSGSLEEFRANEEYGKHWGNYAGYLRKTFKPNKNE